jgi:ABC-type Fe3+/spermidine/putrescine transport system ATPase subunit
MNDMILKLNKVTKRFGKLPAVDQLSLEIKRGEVFTFLGPSGCGKTTTLRMLAGLEWPDEGDIYHRERVLVSASRGIFVQPEQRRMGMVFQSYAIWPNMTVFENIAYPLKLRRFPYDRIKEKVSNVMHMVGLEGLADRPGPLLSGGQQQRVALARALVYEPDVLLLDEPLSNLDAKLREQMRIELKLLQQKLGITLIFVTHDQIEALSLSDRIAVMNRGQIDQLGRPQEIYEKPRTSFVRDFVGKTVVMAGHLDCIDGDQLVVRLDKAPQHLLRARVRREALPKVGQAVFLAVRPEDINAHPKQIPERENRLEGRVEALLFLGDKTECQVRVGEERLLVYVPRHWSLDTGDFISVQIPMDVTQVWQA